MARIARPWFCRQTGWWKVWHNGKKVPLARAERTEAGEGRLRRPATPEPRIVPLDPVVVRLLRGFGNAGKERGLPDTPADAVEPLQPRAEDQTCLRRQDFRETSPCTGLVTPSEPAGSSHDVMWMKAAASSIAARSFPRPSGPNVLVYQFWPDVPLEDREIDTP